MKFISLCMTAATTLAAIALSADRAFGVERTIGSAVAIEDRKFDWAGSQTCRTCHRDQYRSWHRTWHRTMTQEATPDTVKGAFDGRVMRYWGVDIRPVRDGEHFYIEYLDASGAVSRKLKIERTVGSHRYQQYLTQDAAAGPGNYWRIPILWHIYAQRWVHLNGVFLGSDDVPFDSHLTLWNQNCIFCHNTGPEPGITNLDQLLDRARQGQPFDFRYDSEYESDVAELGISCEACHSPGADHAQRNQNPLRRYALALSEADDPTIVNPGKLDHEGSTQICGQCHGQRLPINDRLIMQWLDDGPTFRAGLDLHDHVRPITMDTPPPQSHNQDMFRLRFWNDGTPRLTAYEYQGLTSSACFTEGTVSCISCHTMHEGDPAGQITERNRGNAPCLDCHQSMASDIAQHTGHDADGPGSECRSCHMPKMVYGVMGIHLSHHIEIPRPLENLQAQRPDACTNCHVDQTAQWADSQLNDTPEPASALPRLVVDMLSGDPVQRAVATTQAGLFGNGDSAQQRMWMVPYLMITLQDRYPIMRWFARDSLLAIERRWVEQGQPRFAQPLDDYDFIGDAAERQRRVSLLLTAFTQLDKSDWSKPIQAGLNEQWQPDWVTVETLLRQQTGKDINIGE